MNAAIFVAATVAVLPLWIAMMVNPESRLGRLAQTAWIYLAIAVVYVACVARISGVDPADVLTWDGVRELGGDEAYVVASWLHFLAMDLFVGAWQVRDARQLGLSRLALAGCLWLTFALGPVGLGVYLLVRTRRMKSAAIATVV